MRYLTLALRVCTALLLLGGAGVMHAGAQNNNIHAAAAALSNFQVLPASVVGGKTTFGTLTLTNPAPLGGAPVTIHADNLAVAPIRTLRIPAGVTTFHFVINTYRVLSDVDVTLSATCSGVTKTAPLTVQAKPVDLYGLYTDTPIASGGSGNHTGTVLLDGNAPEGGAIVTLSSDNAAVTVPESVTVPAGQKSANFTFTPNAVANDTGVKLTATYNGISKFTHFLVRPAVPPTIAAIFARDTQAGATGSLQIFLTGPAPNAMQVTISCNPAPDITIASSATIPSGQNSLQVPFQAAMVARPTLVTITVTVGNSSSKTSCVIYPGQPG
ncbi:MAG TPA: hypothetical protein VKU00_09355 [Chthonomonadaceae bacterium]|nr:hypothetical protein [Chthonomonadaceae bacterium]